MLATCQHHPVSLDGLVEARWRYGSAKTAISADVRAPSTLRQPAGRSTQLLAEILTSYLTGQTRQPAQAAE